MGRTFFYARRVVAALIVLLVIWVVASIIYVAVAEPISGPILVLFLAFLGGLLFLFWAFWRVVSGVVRFVAGPSRHDRWSGLGSEYEQMVRAQQRGRWRR